MELVKYLRKIDRIGEVKYNSQGLRMRICRYNNVHDIDIEFDDGYITKNKHYIAFQKGNIENPNYSKALMIDRNGEINYNNQGLKMTIVKYNNSHDIDVEFEDGTIVKHRNYDNFKNGGIKNNNYCKYIGVTNINNDGQKMTIIGGNTYRNLTVKFEDDTVVNNINFKRFQEGGVFNPYSPHVCGVGFIGDSNIKINGKTKKAYSVWAGMIHRCYDLKNKAYLECLVCDEWHNFSDFEKWFDQNYYELGDEEVELDKDILVKGNKIYSPETCIFVPKRINSLFVKSNDDNNKSLGIVWKDKINKYEVRCNIGKHGRKYLGVHSTKEEAFSVYKKFKENYVKQIAEEYKERIPERLYEALYKWKV